MLYETTFKSPIGNLGLLADESQLIELSLHGMTGLSERGKPNKARFKLELKELDFYFKKKLKKEGVRVKCKLKKHSETSREKLLRMCVITSKYANESAIIFKCYYKGGIFS